MCLSVEFWLPIIQLFLKLQLSNVVFFNCVCTCAILRNYTCLNIFILLLWDCSVTDSLYMKIVMNLPDQKLMFILINILLQLPGNGILKDTTKFT